MVQHHKPDCLSKRLICCVHGQQKLKVSVNTCLGDILWTAIPLPTNLCVVVDYHKPECYAGRSVCYLQGQSHSEVHVMKIWLFLLYFLNRWSFWNQTSFHKQGCLVKNRIAVFEVKTSFLSVVNLCLFLSLSLCLCLSLCGPFEET